ncbi:MAG: F0F1 ATP synthase subunit epsilon [Solirubrobacteraceae bacterium]|jgi:F-type H+-transporting ATPase subunit epsilon
MAHARFVAEVLTPEGEVFNEEVEMLSTRTSLGLVGLLANHSPLLARLEPTELRLYRSDSDIVRFAQAEGYVQMAGTHALLLIEEAIDPASLDRRALERQRDEARHVADVAEPNSEEAAVARRDIRRAEAYLQIVDAR